MDQALIQATKRRRIDTQPLGDTRSEAFDGDVGGLCQGVDDLASLFRLHIDGDASLVAVNRKEVGADAVDEGRSPQPRVIAARRRLNLHDLRAHIAEHHGAERARKNP